MAEIKNETFRVSELIRDGILNDYQFERCHLIGPAVFAICASDFVVTECVFNASFVEMAWPVSRDKPVPKGAVILKGRCEFRHCEFHNIGWAAPEEVLRMFWADAQISGMGL